MSTTARRLPAGATAPAVVASADALVDTARALIGVVGSGAALRDTDRVLPRAELDLLSGAGVLAVTVPAGLGGPGGGARHAAEITRLLATVDPNVAQVPQSHFAYLRLAALAGPEPLRRRLFTDVLAGARLANAQSERRTTTVADVSTTVRTVGDHAVVDGEKFYCTGSVLADWLAVLARDEHGEDRVAFVPTSTPGVTVLDDWEALGQRTTASGTVRLEGVRVDADHVVPRHEVVTGPHGYGAFAQLLHAAIDAGIARGALAEAAAFVRQHARPSPEAGVERAEDDPLLVQRFGELELGVRAAEAALAVGADAVDATSRTPTDDAAAEASLAAATAKVLADRAALAVTNGLFELGGTRSSDPALGLDRHWRNARTHTLHDPVRWKLQHLGRHAVSGTSPPRGAQV